MTLAFLFAGQGSQVVGMGADLMVGCAECRELFAAADHALNFSLTELMVDGPQSLLNQTVFAQPALLALDVIHARHLMSLGLKPSLLAGHSLGQYAALVIAGVLDFTAAIRLVALRGRLMQEAVPAGQGAMVAVIGLERSLVYAACAAARPNGIVNVACHNAPEQSVISGETAAVQMAAAECEEAGGSVVPLAVSAPYHCDLLTSMLPTFIATVNSYPFQNAAVPVLDNVEAEPLVDAEALRQSIIRQVTAPVLFEESLRKMAAAGITHVIQCGPGKNLLSFAKRTGVTASMQTFDQAIQSLAALKTQGMPAHELPA
jgi:[acyl-carrier-protein] S-malonyltransferase